MKEDNDFPEDIYAIERAAKNVSSSDQFIEFLSFLREEILKDSEAERRFQLEFLSVILGELKYCAKFSDRENQTINLPDQPDWNWLARLFLIGAFEN
jgi:hypothetical protein